MSLPGNTFAYRLLTPRALDFESDNMGHCVGRGYYDVDVINDKTRIYSIRDERGEPHVTFEVKEPEDSVFVVEQCNGKQNKAPVQKYMDAVQALVEKMNWEIDGDVKNIGLIKIAEKYYSFQDLIDGKIQIPENTVYNGNLDFVDSELTELPDLSNLTVNGYFN